VDARTFPGNPYDGHTLAQQMEQTTNLLLDLTVHPTTAIVDLDYRGVDRLVPAVSERGALLDHCLDWFNEPGFDLGRRLVAQVVHLAAWKIKAAAQLDRAAQDAAIH
jgi:hypothetical protein